MKEVPQFNPEFEGEGFAGADVALEESAVDMALSAIESEVRDAIARGVRAEEIAQAISRGCGNGLRSNLTKFLIVGELTN